MVAPESIAEDYPARIQNVDAYPTGLALEKGQELRDLDAGHAALQKLSHRKPAPPIIHGHHDLADLQPLADPRQTVICPDQLVRWHQALLAHGLHEAHDTKAAAVGTAAQAHDGPRGIADPINQYALLEGLLIDHECEDQARDADPASRAEGGQSHHSAPDPDVRNHVENRGRDGEAGEQRHGDANQHAGEPRALAHAVEPEREQAEDGHRAEQQGPRPQGSRHLSDPGRVAVGVEAHKSRDVERKEEEHSLDEREHRHRQMHIVSEYTDAHEMRSPLLPRQSRSHSSVRSSVPHRSGDL